MDALVTGRGGTLKANGRMPQVNVIQRSVNFVLTRLPYVGWITSFAE